MSIDYIAEFRATSDRGATLSVVIQGCGPDKSKLLELAHKATHLSMTNNESRFGIGVLIKVDLHLGWVTEALLKILPEKLAIRFLSEVIDVEIYKRLLA